MKVYIPAAVPNEWVPHATCCLTSCLRLAHSLSWGICRKPILSQMARVDEDGYATLDWEKLGGLGQSSATAIILKFGAPQASVVHCGLLGVGEAVCPVPYRFSHRLEQAPHFSVAAASSLAAEEV